MLRSNLVRVLCVMLAFAICGVALWAAEATVVSYEKGTVEVMIGKDVKKIELKGVKVTDKNGDVVKGKGLADALKKDVKIETTEEGGKVTAIKIK